MSGLLLLGFPTLREDVGDGDFDDFRHKGTVNGFSRLLVLVLGAPPPPHHGSCFTWNSGEPARCSFCSRHSFKSCCALPRGGDRASRRPWLPGGEVDGPFRLGDLESTGEAARRSVEGDRFAAGAASSGRPQSRPALSETRRLSHCIGAVRALPSRDHGDGDLLVICVWSNDAPHS